MLDDLADPGRARSRIAAFWSLLAVSAAVLLAAGFMFLVAPEEENGWVCSDGEWVQVGKPAMPPPTEQVCIGQEKSRETGNGDATDGGRIPSFFSVPVSFLQQGNLTRGLPGLDPGRLYLAYRLLDGRTEKVGLSFDYQSVCAIGRDIVECSDPRIGNGLKVRVRGVMVGETVTVSELEALAADE